MKQKLYYTIIGQNGKVKEQYDMTGSGPGYLRVSKEIIIKHLKPGERFYEHSTYKNKKP